MKLSKIEAALLAVAAAAVFFAAGYFAGRAVTGDINVTVERREDPAPPPDTGAEDDGLLDINTASAPELATLPGIGEVLAKRIVDYREENGAFRVKEELLNVPGVGETLYQGLENLIKV